jgi:hypothetical protein
METTITSALKHYVSELPIPQLQEIGKRMESQSAAAAETVAESLREAENQAKRRFRLMCWLGGTLMMLLIFAGWWFTQVARPVSMMSQQGGSAEMVTEASQQLAKVTTQLREAEQRLAGVMAAKEQAQSHLVATQETLRQVSQASQALAASRVTEQTELARLQRLNQQFQFRLSPTNDGTVVVEVPENARPFVVGGKRYIAVLPLEEPPAPESAGRTTP